MPIDFGRRALTREQKMGAILLFVFALLTVGLGTLQLRNNIYGPFVIRPKNNRPVATLFTDETVRLQQVDTDQDGLSDYEELQFYNTSPYIPDTDSDGIKDKEEIEAGTDPTCIGAQECVTAEEVSPVVTQDLIGSPLLEETPDALDILAGSIGSSSTLGGVDQERALLEQLAQDPQAIRTLLLQTGNMKQEELDKIDDATLLSIIKDMLKQSVTAP